MIETGWVYVITNESMPELVKVGVTKNRPEHRAKELDETGSPTPYKVETAFLFSKAAERIEKKGHALLADVRVRGNREWFRCPPKSAAEKILDAAKYIGSEILENDPILVTPEEIAEQKKREREEEQARQLLRREEEKASEARKREAEKLKEARRLEEQKLQEARRREERELENAISESKIRLPVERLEKKFKKLEDLGFYLGLWILVYLVGLIYHISTLFNDGLSGFNWRIFVGHTLTTLIICRLYFIRWMRLKTRLRQARVDFSDRVNRIRKRLRLTDSPSRSEKTGWVYVITNESMPGLVKVGVTSNRPEQRAKDLDEIGSPTAYKIEIAFLFSEAAEQVEKQAHTLLEDVRVTKRREWFKTSPHYAALKILDASFHVGSKISKIEPKLSTPEEMADLEKQIQRWEGFSENIILGN